MTRALGACAALAAFLTPAAPALAQAVDAPWRLSLGAGALYRPEFKGSDDSEVQPLPVASFRYTTGDMTLQLEGARFRLDVIGSEAVASGPLIAYQQGRDDDISNRTVRALGEIDAAVEGGVFIERRWRVGSGQISAGAAALTDLSGVHDGFFFALNADYRRRLGHKTLVSLSGEVKWADENYMGAYYDVTSTGAIASGLPEYEAEAGLETVGVAAALIYQLTDRWGVMARAGYERLLNSAADSPIVALEGTADQMTGGLALVYRF